MTLRFGFGAGVFALATLSGGAAFAHHGWSSYEPEKTVKYSGKVIESSWTMPHGSAVLNVDGKSWTVVLAPTARMETRGLAKDEIAVGKTITVEGYPKRDGTPEMRAERISIGAKTVELR